MNQTLSPSRRAYDLGARTLLYLSAALTCGLLVCLIGYICFRGIPGISWSFLTTAASVLRGTVGIFPAIVNTLYVIVVSLVVALPLGVGAAIYLTEYASNRRLVEIIEFATETLAGIPSIIYALVGNVIFCVSLRLEKTLIAGSLTLVIIEDRPPVLPGGLSGPWQRQVAHDPHRGAAQQRGRHRHRLHPGGGPHRGRERHFDVHRQYVHRYAGFLHH